jgi:hypothetical protein
LYCPEIEGKRPLGCYPRHLYNFLNHQIWKTANMSDSWKAKQEEEREEEEEDVDDNVRPLKKMETLY